MNPKRGEIWEVQFKPSIGAEIQKNRPAIILNMPLIGRLPLYIVVPITIWKEQYGGYPWIIKISPSKENKLDKESGADTFQVKSVSSQRLIRKIGNIELETIKEVTAGIALCIGYNV
jgi:mRNA interferase MazF